MQVRAGWTAGVEQFAAGLTCVMALTCAADAEASSALDLRSSPALSLSADAGGSFTTTDMVDLRLLAQAGGSGDELVIAKDYDRGGW